MLWLNLAQSVAIVGADPRSARSSTVSSETSFDRHDEIAATLRG